MSTHLSSTKRHDGRGGRLLSQHDLAVRWRMSIRTLERWRAILQGPPFLKLGRRIAYRTEDIEAFEAAQRTETKES